MFRFQALAADNEEILFLYARAYIGKQQPEKAVEYFQQARAFAFDADLMQEIRKGLFNAYTAMGDTESPPRLLRQYRTADHLSL